MSDTPSNKEKGTYSVPKNNTTSCIPIVLSRKLDMSGLEGVLVSFFLLLVTLARPVKIIRWRNERHAKDTEQNERCMEYGNACLTLCIPTACSQTTERCIGGNSSARMGEHSEYLIQPPLTCISTTMYLGIPQRKTNGVTC